MAELSAAIRISLLDSFSGPLRNIGTKLGGLKTQLSGLGGFKFPSVARFAADLNQAAEGAGRVGKAIAGGLKIGIDEFAGFEKGLSRMRAVAPELSNEAFGRLSADAKQWGADTAFSAQEATKAMENFLAKGFNEDQTRSLGRMTLDFATGNDLGLERASEIVGGVTKSFNQDTAGAAVSMDILSAAAAKSSANAEYLSSAMVKVGPLARTLGMDLSMVAAGASVFAEAQIPAEEGATAFKSILLKLSSSTKHSKDAFKSMGIVGDGVKTLQTLLENNNIPEAFKQIGDAMNLNGFTGTEKLAALKGIFGEEMASQAAVLIDASIDPNAAISLQKFYRDYKKVEEETKSGSSYTTRMAKLMGDNISGEMERTGGAISELSLKLGEILAPSLREALKTIQALAGRIAGFAQANPELAKKLALLTAAFGGLALSASGMLFTLSALTSMFGVAAKGVSVLMSTFGGLGRVALWAARLVPMAVTSFGGMSAVLSGIGSAVAAIGAALASPVAIVAALVAATAAGAYYVLKWTGQLDNVSTWFSERFTSIVSTLRGVFEFFVGAWTVQARVIWSVMSSAFELVVGLASGAAGLVVGAWQAVSGFFGELFVSIGEVATRAFTAIADFIGPNVVAFVQGAWSGIAGFFDDLWNGVAAAFDAILGPVFDRIAAAIDAVRQIGRDTIGSVFGDEKDDEQKPVSGKDGTDGSDGQSAVGVPGKDAPKDTESSIIGMLKSLRAKVSGEPAVPSPSASVDVPKFDLNPNMTAATPSAPKVPTVQAPAMKSIARRVRSSQEDDGDAVGVARGGVNYQQSYTRNIEDRILGYNPYDDEPRAPGRRKHKPLVNVPPVALPGEPLLGKIESKSLIAKNGANGEPGAHGSDGADGSSGTDGSIAEPAKPAAPIIAVTVDTEGLEDLQRQQLAAIREQTKLVDRGQRELQESMRRRPPPGMTGTVAGGW